MGEHEGAQANRKGGAGRLGVWWMRERVHRRVRTSRMSREAHVRNLWGAGGETPPAYPAARDGTRETSPHRAPARTPGPTGNAEGRRTCEEGSDALVVCA